MLYNLFKNRDFVSVFAVALLAEGVDRNGKKFGFALDVYGDNVFEKCGIHRDGAGEVGKPRYFNGKRHF